MTADQLTVRIVVVGIAVLTAGGLVAGVVLQLGDKDAAQAWQLATFGLGALGGILVQAKTQPDATAGAALEQVVEQAGEAGAARKEADVTRYLATRPLRVPPPEGG